jgi:hypothetical protein
MRTNYFESLGLKPARYDSAEIAQRFFDRRARLLAALDTPATHRESRRELDELHIAYLVLRDARSQVAYLKECADGGEDRISRLRRLIAASLEDGLLRCSRRERILEEGRRLGLSEFHTHLLIAQTQFGDMRALVAEPGEDTGARADEAGNWRGTKASDGRAAARLAAAVVLALALLLALLRYLHV